MRITLSIPAALSGDDAEMAQALKTREPFPSGMDEAAFGAFYAANGPTLRGYLRRSSRDAALADDLFQEAFLRFLRTCPAGLDERQQKAYLYRTATSLLIDHWRHARRERMWRLLLPFKEAAADRPAMSADMQRMFGSLKPQEQVLLWMAYVEGFDHREIATALDLSEKSVRVLLFRARKKFAGTLEGTGLGPPKSVPQP